jgi:dolichol-phosphate mannosyltransferase
MTTAAAIDVSVILPAKDEELNLAQVVADVAMAMAGISHEIIVVDDGSADDTRAVVVGLQGQFSQLRLVRHGSACGQSAALRSGIHVASGRIIATMDADGQNPASNLPHLVAPFLGSGADQRLGLVQGQRVHRQDTWSKRIGSKFANAIRNALLHDGVRDSGCGLKAFPRAVYQELAFFDHIHRFMPAMVRREGLEVIVVDVTHAGRQAGQSKYNNTRRALVGVVDLLGVAWLIRRRRVPHLVEVALGAGSSDHRDSNAGQSTGTELSDGTGIR